MALRPAPRAKSGRPGEHVRETPGNAGRSCSGRRAGWLPMHIRQHGHHPAHPRLHGGRLLPFVMAGHSRSTNGVLARLCPGHPRLEAKKDVDARVEPAHDAEYVARTSKNRSSSLPPARGGLQRESSAAHHNLSFVMPGLVPGIHVLRQRKTWMRGPSPRMTPSGGRPRANYSPIHLSNSQRSAANCNGRLPDEDHFSRNSEKLPASYPERIWKVSCEAFQCLGKI
jgi:hypothetical protein